MTPDEDLAVLIGKVREFARQTEPLQPVKYRAFQRIFRTHVLPALGELGALRKQVAALPKKRPVGRPRKVPEAVS